MTTEVLRRRATYEDVLNAPEHMVAEIVDGELFTSPRPAPQHGNALTGLAAEVRGRFQAGVGGPGGWWILAEPELHLGGDVLVPDIAGWRKQRVPALPRVSYFDVAPDWICEVLSPSNAAHDKFRKLPRYALHEVEYAWIVDTVARGVEIYQRQGTRWLQVAMHQGNRMMRAVPFEEGEINLAQLWDDEA